MSISEFHGFLGLPGILGEIGMFAASIVRFRGRIAEVFRWIEAPIRDHDRGESLADARVVDFDPPPPVIFAAWGG